MATLLIISQLKKKTLKTRNQKLFAVAVLAFQLQLLLLLLCSFGARFGARVEWALSIFTTFYALYAK